MSHDWFRNATWNDEVEAAFDAKLRRARRKEQYLRIQASYLAGTYPQAAIALLSRYFAMPDQFDRAQAFVHRAEAHLAMDMVAEAIEDYECALRREAEFPNLLTGAYLRLPLVVATREFRSQYPRAVEVLQAHQKRCVFPVEHFLWHASRALILTDTGLRVEGRNEARMALSAAGITHSGFRYHPGVGLVGPDHEALAKRIGALADLQ